VWAIQTYVRATRTCAEVAVWVSATDNPLGRTLRRRRCWHSREQHDRQPRGQSCPSRECRFRLAKDCVSAKVCDSHRLRSPDWAGRTHAGSLRPLAVDGPQRPMSAVWQVSTLCKWRPPSTDMSGSPTPQRRAIESSGAQLITGLGNRIASTGTGLAKAKARCWRRRRSTG